LIEPNLDVPPADAPAPGHIVGIVLPGQELAEPVDERSLQALHLLGSAGNDLQGLRMTVDLGVEVFDERRKLGFEQGGHALHAPGVRFGPADIALKLLISWKERFWVHGAGFR
jgi:hypothetical protein